MPRSCAALVNMGFSLFHSASLRLGYQLSGCCGSDRGLFLLGAGTGQVDGLGVARPAIAPASDSPAHTPIAGPNPAVNVAGEE